MQKLDLIKSMDFADLIKLVQQRQMDLIDYANEVNDDDSLLALGGIVAEIKRVAGVKIADQLPDFDQQVKDLHAQHVDHGEIASQLAGQLNRFDDLMVQSKDQNYLCGIVYKHMTDKLYQLNQVLFYHKAPNYFFELDTDIFEPLLKFVPTDQVDLVYRQIETESGMKTDPAYQFVEDAHGGLTGLNAVQCVEKTQKYLQLWLQKLNCLTYVKQVNEDAILEDRLRILPY